VLADSNEVRIVDGAQVLACLTMNPQIVRHSRKYKHELYAQTRGSWLQ
jgi:hypothetical protein